MPEILPYNRTEAISYAKKYAKKRNPLYYDYEELGGDCTNFVSQCLYAGSRIMNYTHTYGWYYINTNYHSPSWTGVDYLCNFLTSNKTEAIFGTLSDISAAQVGDVIQLADEFKNFYHTLFIVRIDGEPKEENIYIATHSIDSYDRALSSYSYYTYRLIHIEGVYKKT